MQRLQYLLIRLQQAGDSPQARRSAEEIQLVLRRLGYEPITYDQLLEQERQIEERRQQINAVLDEQNSSSEYYDSEAEGEDGANEDGDDNASQESYISGVPWYLYNGQADAQEGIEVDRSKPEDIAQLKPSLPGPCSDEYICLLVRLATKNKALRRKRVTIGKLFGCPALFIGVEEKKEEATSRLPLGHHDSQIINAEAHNETKEHQKGKKKKKKRKLPKNRNGGLQKPSSAYEPSYLTGQGENLSAMQIGMHSSLESIEVEPELLNRLEHSSQALLQCVEAESSHLDNNRMS